MAVDDRVALDQENELLRRAAADRLGEDPVVVVIRRSDEQIRKQAEREDLGEVRPS
jgi:hypothetical protein